MDYKYKYLKYKIKYLNMIGGSKSFQSIWNNGGDNSGRYSNQCIWISIIDYLNGVLGQEYDLDTIRTIASANGNIINNVREEFDTTIHIEALSYIATLFDLQIHFYVPFRNKSGNLVISERPNFIVGNQSASHVISVVSYGSHFELISNIGGRELYEGNFSGKTIRDSIKKDEKKVKSEVKTEIKTNPKAKSEIKTNPKAKPEIDPNPKVIIESKVEIEPKVKVGAPFVPNIELATGQKLTKQLNDEQLTKLYKLLDDSSDLDRVIIDIQQNIIKSNSELKNLEESSIGNSFVEDNIFNPNDDIDLQTSLIDSFHEYKTSIQNRIDELNKQLKKLILQSKVLKNKIKKYF